MPDSNTRAEREHNVGESYVEERERLDKEAEEWERVRVSLLAGNEESGMTLSERLIQETLWAEPTDAILKLGVTVMDLYNKKMLGYFYEDTIKDHAKTLASIIVGADHE